MTVYLCSTQPDIFRFLANKIEKLGHSCLLFSDYTNLKNTLIKSNYLPDLVLIDYMAENHLLTTNPYEKLDKDKTYLPLIFYNDPCIAKGARAAVWADIIRNFCNKDYLPEGKYVPKEETIETVLKIVADFVESDQFSPYIYLMQKPEPFPESFTTDFLYEKFTYNKNHYKSIDGFKSESKLPESLYLLLQIFFDHKDDILTIYDLILLYSEKKKQVSQTSLKVMLSNLRSYFKKYPEFNYRLDHNEKGYKFSIG